MKATNRINRLAERVLSAIMIGVMYCCGLGVIYIAGKVLVRAAEMMQSGL